MPPPDVLRAQSQGAPPLPTGSYQLEPGYHPQLGALFASGGNAANAASFDSQVRGQESRAIDLDLMQISAAVYDPAVQQVGDWSRVSDADDCAMLHLASVSSNMVCSGKGEISRILTEYIG